MMARCRMAVNTTILLLQQFCSWKRSHSFDVISIWVDLAGFGGWRSQSTVSLHHKQLNPFSNCTRVVKIINVTQVSNKLKLEPLNQKG